MQKLAHRLALVWLVSGVVTVLATPPARAQCTTDPVQVLEAPVPAKHDRLGWALATDGQVAVLGAPRPMFGKGAVFVFGRDVGGPDAWGYVTEVKSDDGALLDEFGYAVGLGGDLLIVGAPLAEVAGVTDAGAVYVFERNAGGPDQWGQTAKLTPGTPQADAGFGRSLALSGNTLLISMSGNPSNWVGGTVFVYERPTSGPGAGTWNLDGVLASSTGPEPNFGLVLALDGDTALVRQPRNWPGLASVRVFERNLGGPGAWGQSQEFFNSDKQELESFGNALALDGNRCLIGNKSDDDDDTESGSAYVFERQAGTWVEVAKLYSPNPAHFEQFGTAVALEAERAVVGANGKFFPPNEDHAGIAYVFDRDFGGAGAWGLTRDLHHPLPEGSDQAGYSVALEAGVALLGVAFDDEGKEDAGSVVVFDQLDPQPTQSWVNYCTAGVSFGGCQATLSACGFSSATASDGFELIATSVEGPQSALFFFGTNGRQANPWGDSSSLQCVVPPVKRTGVQAASGEVGSCNGNFRLDLNARWTAKPQQNPGAGALVQAQLWYRDPLNSANQTTSLSDGIEFLVGP